MMHKLGTVTRQRAKKSSEQSVIAPRIDTTPKLELPKGDNVTLERGGKTTTPNF